MPSSTESDNPLVQSTMTHVDATSYAARIPAPTRGTKAAPTPPTVPPPRLASIDAYRGLVMFLMMAEVLRLCAGGRETCQVSELWELLCHHHQSHVEWVGCSLHDLIQPSFSFLVGVALPFSMASRLARGESKARMTAHALWRSLLLVALGVFLRSRGQQSDLLHIRGHAQPDRTGLYIPVRARFFSARVQWIALG